MSDENAELPLSKTTYVVFLGHLLILEDLDADRRSGGSTVELISLHDGTFHVGRDGERGLPADAVALAPRSGLHVGDGSGACARLYVEAHSFHGRALRQQLGAARDPFTAVRLGRQIINASAWDAIARLDFVSAVARMLDGLEDRQPRRPLNAAVSAVLARLDRVELPPPSLGELSRGVEVPVDRLRGMFVQMLGMTVSTYAAWLRLRRLCGTLRAASLDEAATRAGFRSGQQARDDVRRLFGMAGDELLAGRWLAR